MKKIILFFCIFQLSTIAKSQDTNSRKNISLELGMGYNTAIWKGTTPYEITSLNRNQFTILPSFKLKYTIPLFKIKPNSTFEATLFVGYNMFGGKSKKESNGYKDIILLQSLEIGVLPTYLLNNKLNLYGGLKGQYIFSTKQKSYGTLLSSIDTEREWETSDMNGSLKKISFNLGAGFNYKINRFFFGIETWFGITNLSKFEVVKIYENNYRLIIGYRI